MQVLSLWPSKGGLFVVPQLDSEFGSTFFPSIRRRTRKGWGLVNTVFHGTSSGLLIVSSNSRYARIGTCMSSKFDRKNGFLTKYSKLKFVLFCEPKKGSFGSSIALAWALEQQEIGSEFHGGDSSLDDGLLEERESNGDVFHNLEDGDDHSYQEENRDHDLESDEESREEKHMRIDVRALAWSLHSAKTADDVEEILKDKGELPLQVYSSTIRGFGWDKKIESALAVVEWLRRKKEEGRSIGPNLFIYNSLLNAVKQSEQFEKTEKILNDMTQEGIAANVVTYNTLMAIYVEQGHATLRKFIIRVLSLDLHPIPLLWAYRRMEDGNGALAFYTDIKVKYLKGEIGQDSDEDWEKELVKRENFITHICCQVMRRWLVRHDNFSTNVLNLLTNMDKAGVQPSRAEYERLVWACTHEYHYVVGKDLYDRIRERYSEISL